MQVPKVPIDILIRETEKRYKSTPGDRLFEWVYFWTSLIIRGLIVITLIDKYIPIYICSPYWILLFSFVFQLMIGCISEQRLASHCRKIISFNNREVTIPETVDETICYNHDCITLGQLMICFGVSINEIRWDSYKQTRLQLVIQRHNRTSNLKWSFDNTYFSVSTINDGLPVHQLSWNSPVFILFVCDKRNVNNMI